MSFLRVDCDVSARGTSATDIQKLTNVTANDKRNSVRRVLDFIRSVAQAHRYGIIRMVVGAVRSTATLTFTGAPTASETFSLANVTITALDGTADEEDEFDVTGTVAGDAAAVAALINAHSVLGTLFSATSDEGVVTITSKVPGVVGNGTEFSESLTNATITQFANGADGDRYEFDLR